MNHVTTLTDALCEFIDAEVSLDPDTPVEPDTDLLTTGLVDSLGAMEIVHWIEDAQDLDIDPVEVTIENFQTVERMVALVTRLKAQ